jgi:putative membrane protein
VTQGKTLVICVDRDNDIGEKGGVATPVIGREASLAAATKLALADPEESDSNAIFEAIRICDELKSGEEDAEIVLIAGDKNVGIKSDRRIGEELDEVLSLSQAGMETRGEDEDDGVGAIVVTDGAEDESIMPIIQSRIKIDGVRRIVVKQSEPLESTFYAIKKAFEDPKFARTFLLPIGLIFSAVSISMLVGHVEWAIGLILGFIGVYMLLKGLGLEEVIGDFVNAMKQSFYTGKISFVTYVCAIVLLLVGTLQGIIGSWDFYTQLGFDARGYRILLSMVYAKWAVGWYVVAALFPVVGKMVSMAIDGEKIATQWTILSSIIASGLALWGGSECIIQVSEGNLLDGYQILLFSILGAIIVSLIGVGVSVYARRSIISQKGEDAGESENDSELEISHA